MRRTGAGNEEDPEKASIEEGRKRHKRTRKIGSVFFFAIVERESRVSSGEMAKSDTLGHFGHSHQNCCY